MMNTKYKLVRLVVSAVFGSLLWAGCASDRNYCSTKPVSQSDCSLEQNDSDVDAISFRPVNLVSLSDNTGLDLALSNESACCASQSSLIGFPLAKVILQ